MHRLQFSLRIVCCALLVFFVTTIAGAQFRASIQGTVTDTSGGLIPEATVTVTNKGTAKEEKVTTSNEGFYRVSALAPGSYTVSVEKTGYKKKVFENVTVNAEATQGLDITLDVGDVSAVVTVSEETAPVLETENANVDKAITTQEVRTLPQFGRDPYELARLLCLTPPDRADQVDRFSKLRINRKSRLTDSE